MIPPIPGSANFYTHADELAQQPLEPLLAVPERALVVRYFLGNIQRT